MKLSVLVILRFGRTFRFCEVRYTSFIYLSVLL